MIKTFQTNFEPGKGNCLQACVASILELPLGEVPNFALEPDWSYGISKFVSEYGLSICIIDRKEDGLLGRGMPGCYSIVTGKSPRRDVHHAVVAFDGELVHDPFMGGNCELLSLSMEIVFVAPNPANIVTKVKYDDALKTAREVAKEYGYALGVHGSQVRDLDLIAAPWTFDARPAEDMVHAICGAVKGIIIDFPDAIPQDETKHNPVFRPHGRRAWSIQLGSGRYIDISVMPTETQGAESLLFHGYEFRTMPGYSFPHVNTVAYDDMMTEIRTFIQARGPARLRGITVRKIA